MKMYSVTITEKIIIAALLADEARHKQYYLEMLADQLGIDISYLDYDHGVTP